MLFVLKPGDGDHEAVIHSLRTEEAAVWSARAVVASYDKVIAIPLMTYESAAAGYLSTSLRSGATVVSVQIHDSDVALIDVYESGDHVAHAIFGLDVLVEMTKDFNDLVELGLLDNTQISAVPTEAVSGLVWWTTNTNLELSTDIDALVNSRYTFVEEHIDPLLGPLGISTDMLNIFGPDLILDPGSARVTPV